jgi:hypothetical protein
MKYFKGSGVSYKSLGTSVLDIRSRSRWCNDYRACHWTQVLEFKPGR